MHVYLYDPILNEKKYQSNIARIETRLTDLGLNGKIIRLGVLQSISNAIETDLKNKANTIVVVGGVDLLNKTINILARASRMNPLFSNIPIGFIPINEKNNDVGGFLGIKPLAEACDVLSGRRIQTLDLGLINNEYFFTYSTIPTTGTVLEIDKSYSVEITESGNIYVINLPVGLKLSDEIKTNAKDEKLELFIQTKKNQRLLRLQQGNKNNSIITFKNLRIVNPKLSIVVDQSKNIKTPVDLTIAKEKVNLIIGKNRSF